MGEVTLSGAKFNKSLRIETRAERLTGEAGAVMLREAMERLGLRKWLVPRLIDRRKAERITHPLAELVSTSVLLMAQGWRDNDDADALRNDGVMRLSVSTRRGIEPLRQREAEPGKALSKNPPVPDGLASQPTLSRLHRALSEMDNVATLRQALLYVAAQRHKALNGGRRLGHVTLDVDGVPLEVHGQQPGSAYNGYCHSTVYHPLVASIAELGDLLDVELREGQAHSAEGSLDFIPALVRDVKEQLADSVGVRLDAGFPSEPLLKTLEDDGIPYVARVRNNAVLDRMARPHQARPPGRPPHTPRTWFTEYTYQAKSWSRPRRVVLVTVEKSDQLILDHFWIITSRSVEEMDGPALLDLYRQRGTAEGHQGEFKDVLAPALSSSPRPKRHYRGRQPVKRFASGNSFAINEVRLLLHALAYNVLHVLRVLLEQATGTGWSLRRLRERVLRTSARVLLHGRRAVLVLAKPAAVFWHALWPRLAALQAYPSTA